MRKIFLFGFFTVCLQIGLLADDIHDSRESALKAMQQAKTVLKEAEKSVQQIIDSTGTGKNVVQDLSRKIVPVLNQMEQKISKVGASDEINGVIVPDTQVTDTASKIMNRFNQGMKDLGTTLQNVQQGAGNISIPDANQAQVEQIKKNIADSLNSSGGLPAERTTKILK